LFWELLALYETHHLIGHLQNPGTYKHCYSYVTGHLIGLLESLGTQSITAIELKQLIGLLRLDEEEKQVITVLTVSIFLKLSFVEFWTKLPTQSLYYKEMDLSYLVLLYKYLN
jgi:hypothetical protein